MSLIDFKSTILPSLKQIYPSLVINEEKSDNRAVILRLNLSSDEAENFKAKFSDLTYTNWIVYSSTSNPQKLQFRKGWVCHNSNYRKKSEKRNADCKAKFSITIKKVNRNTIKNDFYLNLNPPLCAEVYISLEHSHNITSAGALRLLRVNDKTKEQFFQYFSNGMSPAEAARLHENKLLVENNFQILANSSQNPTQEQIHYLHNCWRHLNLGTIANPFDKLKEKMEFYELQGTTIKLYEGERESWAVVLATPVMKRTQGLKSSAEMIFVDSTCSCERSSSTLTVLLSATKVGAIPIAVLIHAAQTTENYRIAFQLLKETFPFCFGGRDHPDIFMTDDSAAEKGALKHVWPSSLQLLCHFHVAQAQWRWLFAQRDIAKEERPRLMKLFQAVMYSSSNERLTLNVQKIIEEQQYPAFVTRFLSFYERKQEWVLFFRKNLITRNNNTNNFAEATVRILKDVVLNRTRAFNVVALSEFCISVWEKYLISKLLDFAHSRRVSTPIYSSLNSVKSEDFNISELVANIYEIKNTTKNNSYIVYSDIGVCTCPVGISGAFCKHQYFLMKNENLILPNAPILTCSDKYDLAILALGSKCPPMSFFLELKENLNENNEEIHTHTQTLDLNTEVANENESEMTQILIEPEGTKQEILDEFQRISNLIQNEPNYNSSLLLNTLKQIKNVNDLSNLCYFKWKGNRKKIAVQPTSIARRRLGLVKSGRRIPPGRPVKNVNYRTQKQTRNLSKSISKNVPNAKSHSSTY